MGLLNFSLLEFTTLASFLLITKYIDAYCDQNMCASYISKCQLRSQCRCSENNTSCLETCISCMNPLFSLCCPCLGFPEEFCNATGRLNKTSHSGKLDGSVPSLFGNLIEGNRSEGLWESRTYFMDELGTEITREIPQTEYNNGTTVRNCSMVFMTKCHFLIKCKLQCLSMGASGYRLFLGGCCVCLGDTCLDDVDEQLHQCRNGCVADESDNSTIFF